MTNKGNMTLETKCRFLKKNKTKYKKANYFIPSKAIMPLRRKADTGSEREREDFKRKPRKLFGYTVAIVTLRC